MKDGAPNVDIPSPKAEMKLMTKYKNLDNRG
jgi:hypothetical protein